MSKSAHTEAQIIAAVKQVESGRKAEEFPGKWECPRLRFRQQYAREREFQGHVIADKLLGTAEQVLSEGLICKRRG
jgi:hypothetical protein